MDSVERQVCSSSIRLPCESYLNAQIWLEQTYQNQSDYLIEGYVSSLLEKPYTDLTQNYHYDLATFWKLVGPSKKKSFRETYGDIASLILVPTKKMMLWAAMRFWDSSYRCFTFGKKDLIPTIEEYLILIGVDLQHPNKVYNKKPRA